MSAHEETQAMLDEIRDVVLNRIRAFFETVDLADPVGARTAATCLRILRGLSGRKPQRRSRRSSRSRGWGPAHEALWQRILGRQVEKNPEGEN